MRGINRSEIERWIGMRENSQLIHRSRPSERVRRRANVIAVIVMVHLQYGERGLIRRFIQLYSRNTHDISIYIKHNFRFYFFWTYYTSVRQLYIGGAKKKFRNLKSIQK